jgi:hypothetical protein
MIGWKVSTRLRWVAVSAVVATMTATVYAVTYGIDPDDYSGTITGLTPKATLVIYRANNAGTGFQVQRVLSVDDGGTWAPTGTKVFGHDLIPGEEAPYHWDNLNGPSGAWRCYTAQECGDFSVFGAWFPQQLARSVTIRTTMRGEQAIDPVELWAFDKNGIRLLTCKLDGVTSQVLQTADLPGPYLYKPSPPRNPAYGACGRVLEKKNCAVHTNAPGDCDYVVEMTVTRPQVDIRLVWFGGSLWDNTHANLDALSYDIP